MEASMIEDPTSIIFKRLGERVCTKCWDETGKAYAVMPDIDGFRAFRREVYSCSRCDLMAIGEPIPTVLNKYFDDFPEEPPERERIAV
jgi:hypothetical protein